MLVYRVETENGEGAFRSGLVGQARSQVCRQNEYGDYELDPARHPGPDDYREGDSFRDAYMALGDGRNAFYFGFSSMAQLLRWFDSEALRVEMNQLGLAISVYWVPTLSERIEGTYQTVFKRGKKKPRERFPLPTLAEVTP